MKQETGAKKKGVKRDKARVVVLKGVYELSGKEKIKQEVSR